MFDQIFAYFIVTVFVAAAFLFILSGPIVDWLSAREKRKKAAAEAEAATKSPQAAADRIESITKQA